MKRPLVILSFDGLSTKDIEKLSEFPGFKRFLKDASGSKNVSSIYPSVTYAAHASIISGCYPVRHGIIDNTKVQPERFEHPDWYWYHKDFKVPTLYEIAIDNGYQVAALLWPTTGRSRIHYNMPEIFSNRKWTSQMMVSVYAGSPSYQLKMVKKHGHLRDGKHQPALDHFTTASTLETIHQYQPDMLLVHLTDLDSIRHRYGHNSEEATQALERHDHRLTQILDALATYEKYNHAYIVILGDHSSKDVTHGISVNAKLKEMGYLSESVNQLTQVKAYAKSCDGSCYIYGYGDESANQKVCHELHQAFKSMPEVELIDHAQMVAMGADASAMMMLEAKPPYHFVDDLISPWILPISEIPYYTGVKTTAVHGFRPDIPDYNTVFYLKGPNIQSGVEIQTISLVDIAPTLAHIMGWSLPDVDGHSFHNQILES